MVFIVIFIPPGFTLEFLGREVVFVFLAGISGGQVVQSTYFRPY